MADEKQTPESKRVGDLSRVSPQVLLIFSCHVQLIFCFCLSVANSPPILPALPSCKTTTTNCATPDPDYQYLYRCRPRKTGRRRGARCIGRATGREVVDKGTARPSTTEAQGFVSCHVCGLGCIHARERSRRRRSALDDETAKDDDG